MVFTWTEWGVLEYKNLMGERDLSMVVWMMKSKGINVSYAIWCVGAISME